MRKKLLAIFAFIALLASACQNNSGGNTTTEKLADNHQTEAFIRKTVEQMMEKPTDQIMTDFIYNLQQNASSVSYEAEFFFGFEWNGGVFDVCSENAGVRIDSIRVTDSTHSFVDMRWFDEPCYDIPYTLQLLWEDGQWKINEVEYHEDVVGGDDANTLSGRCRDFYQNIAQYYSEKPADEIMAYLLTEEPSEESYTKPGTIYYNNPKEISKQIERIRNCHQLFKQNPNYTESYGEQINAIIARIEQHL